MQLRFFGPPSQKNNQNKPAPKKNTRPRTAEATATPAPQIATVFLAAQRVRKPKTPHFRKREHKHGFKKIYKNVFGSECHDAKNYERPRFSTPKQKTQFFAGTQTGSSTRR
jgi:hypothetical protein